MKKVLSLLAIVLFSTFGFSQSRVNASAFAGWTAKLVSGVSSGAATLVLDNCFYQVPGGSRIFPLSTVIPLTVTGANTDTATPSAVTTPVASAGSPNGYTCTATVTLSNAHSAGEIVSFGDGGFGAAVANVKSGIVVLDGAWSSPTAIGSLPAGNSNVSIADERTGPAVSYCWSGTAYLVCNKTTYSANGAAMTPFYNEELVTLATGAATTDTTGNLLPANSIILAVGGRVTTTITSACTGWELGDATTAARFTTNDTTLTAAEAKVNSGAFLTTAIASATTGPYQSSAAKVRITCAGGNPGAGVVRVFVSGFTFTAPAK